MVTKSPRAAHTARADEPELGSLDRYFGITARGSTIGREIRGGIVTFFTMAYIIALNPLIIGTAPDSLGNLVGGLPYADGAGRGGRRQRRPDHHEGRRRDRPGRRGDDHPDGRHRPVPDRHRRRARAERSAGLHHRTADDLAAGDGADRDRGGADRPAGADRLPDRGVQGGAAVPAGGHLDRHRLVHHLRRAVRRRLRAQAGRYAAGGARRERLDHRLAVVDLRPRAVRGGDPLRQAGQGRTADLHRGCHRRRRADRAGHRCRGEDRRQPHGLGAQRPPGRLDRGRCPISV